MAVLANRVKVAVDGTPGTGTIDLGAAVTGFQSFADGGITNGQVVSYAIEDGDAWEIGTGTYTTGTPNTLSRTVIESSNSDAALDLSSNAVVFITALSGDLQNAVDMDQGVATTDSPSFADLTLSGGVYLGGTGSANYLDDYEEGTWTPVAADAETGGNTGSWAVFNASYIKTGKLVTIFCDATNLNVTGMTSGNTLYVTGLPFISEVVALGSVSGRFTGGSEIHQNSTVSPSGSSVSIQTQNAGANEGYKTVGNFSSGGDDLAFTITYTTA